MVYDVIKKRYRSSDKGIAKVMQWRAKQYKENSDYREKDLIDGLDWAVVLEI